MTLQDKIAHLQNLASRLSQIECSGTYLYADDLSQLNSEIHAYINELYPLHGGTMEQEASLSLALLRGYSVCMYAGPDDDLKRHTILNRSRQLLKKLPPSSLKQDLLTVCREYAVI